MGGQRPVESLFNIYTDSSWELIDQRDRIIETFSSKGQYHNNKGIIYIMITYSLKGQCHEPL